MASINGMNSNNRTSSLYNSSKTISGLASGLDTEGMIEGLVQSYQKKITSLSQKATKVQWKQESYRDIISRMAKFTEKYTSYASSTNLMSSNFFNNAIKVAAQGANAGKVTASGKSSSDVVLNRVDQLASAARYVTESRLNVGNGQSIEGTQALSFQDSEGKEAKITLGNLQGSLSLTYGDRVISLSFDEVADKFSKLAENPTAADKAGALAEVINEKLKDQKITLKSGESVSAADRIEVKVEDGKISFTDKSTAGNSVYLSGASGNIKEVLGLNLDNAKEDKPSVIQLADATELTKSVSKAEYLSGKSMSITLDKVTKTIKLPEIVNKGTEETPSYVIKDMDGNEIALTTKTYAQALQESVDGAFGSGKITVGADGDKLKFTATQNGSDLLINSDVGEALGLGGKTASNYLNTGKTLGDLLNWPGLKDDLTLAKDSQGNTLKDKNGNDLYEFKINGVVVGNFNEDSKLSDVMNAVNANTKAGVKMSYSRISKEFVFTATEIGANSKIDFGTEGLAARMFGAGAKFGSTEDAKITSDAGKNAKFTVTVNGTVKPMERSSNSVDIDGLTINFKESFTEGEGITFKSSADADKIVTAVKDMIKDYNEMMGEVKKIYSTLPAQKSSGASYEPLTDNDLSTMSESAIKQYEEKAKQGILFGDSTMSGLYDKLRFVFSPTGNDGAMLRKMGITSGYSGNEGASVALDESKLRAMLESDPEAVAEMFTKSKDAGAATDGVMQSLKTQMDNYGRLSGSTKGILVERAGSPLSPLSLMNNTYQKDIDRLNQQIESWQTKLATKVDSYTSKFSRLESVIQQMNSQSSMLSGMMGG